VIAIGPPEAVTEQVAQALHQLAAHARLGSRLRNDLGSLDPQDEDGRSDKADRIEEDRVWGRNGSDERARKSWSGELRARAADLQLRVALDEALPLHQRGQERLVRDVEEHRADADEESDGIELPDGQRVEGVGDRDRAQRQSAAEVAEDEDRLPR